MNKIIKNMLYNIHKKIKEAFVAFFNLYIKIITTFLKLILNIISLYMVLLIILKRKLMFYIKEAIIFPYKLLKLIFKIVAAAKILHNLTEYIKYFFNLCIKIIITCIRLILNLMFSVIVLLIILKRKLMFYIKKEISKLLKLFKK